MASENASTNDQSTVRVEARYCGGRGKCGNWSCINIAAMVAGFILFWPIGLFLLFWIFAGGHVHEVPRWVSQQWSKVTDMRNGFEGFGSDVHSDNVVFNEFQQTQYDRIREIREEIKERARRFTQFRTDAKRRADEEEFNRFMADAPARADS